MGLLSLRRHLTQCAVDPALQQRTGQPPERRTDSAAGDLELLGPHERGPCRSPAVHGELALPADDGARVQDLAAGGTVDQRIPRGDRHGVPEADRPEPGPRPDLTAQLASVGALDPGHRDPLALPGPVGDVGPDVVGRRTDLHLGPHESTHQRASALGDEGAPWCAKIRCPGAGGAGLLGRMGSSRRKLSELATWLVAPNPRCLLYTSPSP